MSQFIRLISIRLPPAQVIGSSLFVYSGYRFALMAKEVGIPLAILNIGETRADHLADVKVGGVCTQVLDAITEKMIV